MRNERRSDYYRIEMSRESRLWISQVVVPAACAVALIWSTPELKQGLADFGKSCKNKVVSKFNSAKSYIEKKFKKEEE